jgi:HD-GYP domain-containing protein (c-di-GMP phosphodiesterase class II)
MRLMPIGMCTPGMKLRQSIYNDEGLVLLAENVELTESLIVRLQQHGIDYVYVQDPRTDDLVMNEPLEPETKARTLKEIRRTFKRMADAPERGGKMPYFHTGRELRSLMEDILDDLSGHPDAMSMLTNICVTDSYLYQHSMNVCVYTTMLGIAEGYDRDALFTLGLGSILHDIGKVRVPQHILLKRDSLTKEEILEMQQHTVYGYNMLKDEPNIPLLSAHCAFQHHERYNGSGYPRGIRGDDIHEYAQWIAVTDAFDAMTTHRVYRNAMLPHIALEQLTIDAGTLFDPRKVDLFRNKIAAYPIGMTVGLSTGEVGIVVDLNSDQLQRPVVRVLYDEGGDEVTAPHEIDLSKRKTVSITQVNPVNAKPEARSN